MRGQPIGDEERSQIIALAQAGKSYRAIAEALRRPFGTVGRVLRDAVLCGALKAPRKGRPGSQAMYNAFHGKRANNSTPKYAAERDGLACVRCGRSKNSHNRNMECLPVSYRWDHTQTRAE